MLTLLELVTNLARSGWTIALAFAVQATLFAALRASGRRFSDVAAGFETFDFQNRLTTADMRAQLPAYTEEARRRYQVFFALDLLFPFFASLSIALLWAALLAVADTALARALTRSGLPLLAFAATVFDWGENAVFLAVIERSRSRADLPSWASFGVAFKRAKLASLALTALGTLALVLVAGFALLRAL